MHACMSLCMCACVCSTGVYVCVRVCMHACLYACVHVFVPQVCVCVYIVWVCIVWVCVHSVGVWSDSSNTGVLMCVCVCVCGVTHPTLEYLCVQKAHFKSDWHRYNLKQQLKGDKSVTEDQFETITGTYAGTHLKTGESFIITYSKAQGLLLMKMTF